MAIERSSNSQESVPGRRRRLSRGLALFGLASVAAHAAVIGLLPGLFPDSPPPPVTLEVVLSQPEPLPVAPAQAEPAPERKPEPQRKRIPERVAAKAVPEPQVEPQPPTFALPAAPAPAEVPFTAPAARPAAQPPATESKPQVASLAVAPPVFNAAYLRNPAPNYPLAARRSGTQGTVTLRVLVTPEGLPARVELERTSGSVHLDAAALDAVKAWRFTPARRGTEAVEGWVMVPVVFRLEG